MSDRLRLSCTLIALAIVLGAAPPAVAPAGPFGGLDVVKLVVTTPGVTPDPSRSTQKRVWVSVAGQRYGGFVRADRATSGKTIDDDWLLAVPLDSASPEGAFVALVYRSTGGPPDYVAAVDSKRGLLQVAVRDGHLFVTAPVFAKHDAPCCPSSQVVERMLYSPGIDGLIVVTTQHVNAARPATSVTALPR